MTAFALGWFVYRTGGAIALPWNTQWLLVGDWAATWHGWLFFIGGRWTLPPGLTPDLLHPFGSSVFYTNSVFWLALPAKLLEPLVGRPFQLYGLYLASSFAGLGAVSLWLFRRLSFPPAVRLLGAALLVMSPVVVARFGHLAMTAHWVVLLPIALAVSSVHEAGRARRNAVLAVLVVAFAVGVDGYLAAIVAPVALAGLLISRIRGGLRWWEVGALVVALFGSMLIMLWVVGAFPGTPMNRTTEGLGDFSSDLTTLFNPAGTSRWIPGIRVQPRQGEGFGYLGLGLWALLPLALAGAIRGGRRTLRILALASPLVVVCLALGIYALSPRVTFGGQTVVELWGPFKLLGPLPSMFRATGRFIWCLHWLVALGAVLGTVRLLGPRWAALPLGLGLVVQAVESPPRREQFAPRQQRQAGLDLLGIGEHYRHLKLVPLQAQWICRYDEALVGTLSELAYREKMTLNSGLVGRYPAAIEALCHERHRGPLDPDTVYLPRPDFLQELEEVGACGVIDGQHVCVSPHRDTPLLRRLRGG